MDVDQYVSERQGLRLERSSDLGGVNRGASDLGLGTRKGPRSDERPLTFSKASRGLVPKTISGDVEADDGQQQVQGEQGKLLLEVKTNYWLLPSSQNCNV